MHALVFAASLRRRSGMGGPPALALVVSLSLIGSTGCGGLTSGERERSFASRLYTPTYVTKIGDHYFIVDCWHHRIIYSDDLARPIGDWRTLTEDIAGPHSIASDGDLLLTEDTGRHRVQVFRRDGGEGYRLSQVLNGVGMRPHRTLYDPQSRLFYVLGSGSQDIMAIRNRGGRAVLEYVKKLAFLEKAYTRSMSIIDGRMVFASGPSRITVAEHGDASYSVVATYEVPPEIAGMNDIAWLEGHYYLTSTPRKLVRVADLSDLRKGRYEDLTELLGYRGTPYYFSTIDGRVFLPEITEWSAILSFQVRGGVIGDVITHHDFGPPTPASLRRKKMLPT